MIFVMSAFVFLVIVVIGMKILEVLQEKRRQREANWDAIEDDESLYKSQWVKMQCPSCCTNMPRAAGKFSTRIFTPRGPSLLRVAENKGPLLPVGEVITLQRCFTCGAVWRVRQYGCFRRKA